jgi:hypothetical protein
MVVMFSDRGAAIDPMTCPSIVNAKDGGFMITATNRNPAPKVLIAPAAINYTRLSISVPSFVRFWLITDRLTPHFSKIHPVKKLTKT